MGLRGREDKRVFYVVLTCKTKLVDRLNWVVVKRVELREIDMPE